MPRPTIFLAILLAVITVFSGCADNGQKQDQPDPNPNKQAQNSTSTPTSTQATTTPKEDLPVWPDKEFTEEDYEGWKTYTHEDLGFKIKHPSNWEVKVLEAYHDIKSVTINPPDAKYYVSYITVGPETRSLEEIRNVYKDPGNYEGDAYKEKKILFASKESYYFFDGGVPNSEKIVIPHNDKIYSINSQKINNPKVIQSLASFEFIE